MLTSIKANSLQTAAQLELMGHPNAFPSVPVASASDWTIKQSLHYQTLCLTVIINGGSAHWKAATTNIMQGVESTRQLLRNLREKDRQISPTVHASVLLMPTQKFLREVIDLQVVTKLQGHTSPGLRNSNGCSWTTGCMKAGCSKIPYKCMSHVLEALLTQC